MPMISDVKSCLFHDGILGCTILMGGLLSMKCVCLSVSFAMIAYLFMCFVEYNSPPMTENRGACSTANMNGHGHDVSSFLNAKKKRKKKGLSKQNTALLSAQYWFLKNWVERQSRQILSLSFDFKQQLLLIGCVKIIQLFGVFGYVKFVGFFGSGVGFLNNWTRIYNNNTLKQT